MTSSRGLAFCLCLVSWLLISDRTVSGAIVNFESTINGPSANGGVGTGSLGIGSAIVTLDDVTNLLSWSGSFSGLTGDYTISHFHGPALPNQNAGVQVIIDVVSALDGKSGTFSGSATITTSQANDLLNDLWYINIHSTAFPGGEIRGQVNTVPEPNASALICLGLFGIATRRRSRNAIVWHSAI